MVLGTGVSGSTQARAAGAGGTAGGHTPTSGEQWSDGGEGWGRGSDSRAPGPCKSSLISVSFCFAKKKARLLQGGIPGSPGVEQL